MTGVLYLIFFVVFFLAWFSTGTLYVGHGIFHPERYAAFFVVLQKRFLPERGLKPAELRGSIKKHAVCTSIIVAPGKKIAGWIVQNRRWFWSWA